jgi:hypothetical protein
MPTHKFHLGQVVEFNPPRGVYAPMGPYVVTAKLPGLDGVFEYRVRHTSEQHDRAALENELSAVEDRPPTENIKTTSARRSSVKSVKSEPTVKQKRT